MFPSLVPTRYGAATCGNGNTGITGIVTTTNSIIGPVTGPTGPDDVNRIFARDLGKYFANNPFVVSFPLDGSGRVILSALGVPIVPPTPSSAIPANILNKGLYAFYRSIADAESGQRWNFWEGNDISRPISIEYRIKSYFRHVNEGPFYPHYQQRGPFKYK